MRKHALFFTLLLSFGYLQSAKASSTQDLFMASLGWPPIMTMITKIFFRRTNQSPIVQRTTGVIASALITGALMMLAVQQEKTEKENCPDKPLPSYNNSTAFAGGAFVGAFISILTDFGIDLGLAGAHKIGCIFTNIFTSITSKMG